MLIAAAHFIVIELAIGRMFRILEALRFGAFREFRALAYRLLMTWSP